MWLWLSTLGLPIVIFLILGRSMGRLFGFAFMIPVWHIAVIIAGYISSGEFELLGLVGYFTSVGGMMILLVQAALFLAVANVTASRPRHRSDTDNQRHHP